MTTESQGAVKSARIPPSVMAAVGALVLLMALDTIRLWPEAASWPVLLPLTVRGLVVIGLLRRSRVAWGLVRIWGLALAIINPFLHAREILPDGELSIEAAAFELVGSGLLVAAWWFVGRESSVAFFGLICPGCGRKATRPFEVPNRGGACRMCNHPL